MKLKDGYGKGFHTGPGRLDDRSILRQSAQRTKTATAATAARRPAAELNDAEMAPLPPFRFDGELPEPDAVCVPEPDAVFAPEPEPDAVLVPVAVLLLVTPKAVVDCVETPSGL
jgi:hypothetical protein